VRPSELFDPIHRIATGKEPADANLRENARKLLVALGVDGNIIDEAGQNIADFEKQAKDLAAEARKALDSISDAQIREKVQNEVDTAFRTVADKVHPYATAAAEKIIAAAGTIDGAFQKFEYWSCASQERAQQWLTMHTRVLTVIFAFAFALLLQLDTVEIFKTVSINRAMRDKLIAETSGVLGQAGKILVDRNTVLSKAFKNWTDGLQADTQKNIEGKIVVDANDTRGTLRRKVETALGASANKDAALSAFDAEVDRTAEDELKNTEADYKLVKADLDKTGFELFPKNGWRWIDENRGHNWWNHLPGMFFSILLLSLGAPFWYNMLKNLTNLRSQVAQNISKEQEEALKRPEPAKPKPPPTVIPPSVRYSIKVPTNPAEFAAAKALQKWLISFSGVSLAVDGVPGIRTSDAFKLVPGRYLVGDPRG
jgi:hypothetical protein